VHTPLYQVVRVQALARDIVLCPRARHFTLTVPLSIQVYKWVPVNLMLGGNPALDWHPIQVDSVLGGRLKSGNLFTFS